MLSTMSNGDQNVVSLEKNIYLCWDCLGYSLSKDLINKKIS